MFRDIHSQDDSSLEQNWVKGANFDEILYADDTICISQNEQAMNTLLAKIETEGDLYGMKINKNKCEHMQHGRGGASTIRWRDKAQIAGWSEVDEKR